MNKSNRKWYGGNENDFHYNLIIGLVVGVGIYFILFFNKIYSLLSGNICLFLFMFIFCIIFLYLSNIYCFFIFNNIDKSFKSNVYLSQKKFYCDKIELKEQIFIKSKSKKELSKIDLQKEVEKLDKEIDLNIVIESMEYLKNFKGFIILFNHTVSLEKDGEKKNLLGITFFNFINIEISKQVNYFPTMSIWKLYTDEDYDTIIFILNLFFVDWKKIDEAIYDKWKESFNIQFNKIMDENYFNVYLDKNIPVEFYKFSNLKDLINFIESVNI